VFYNSDAYILLGHIFSSFEIQKSTFNYSMLGFLCDRRTLACFFVEICSKLSFYFQTQSDFSDTSSVSESRHLFEDERAKGQSNVPMTSFNFINSIIGSGVIGK